MEKQLISKPEAGTDSKDSQPAGEQPNDTISQCHNEDRFDLEKLRLSQAFDNTLGVKKRIFTVSVKKPDRQWWVRVHPDETYRLKTAVLELKEERETYLVDSSLWSELSSEIIRKELYTAMNRQGIPFIWPVRLPGPDGRHDAWNRCAAEAAELATRRWIRLASNMHLGAYDVFEATGDLPEPDWPEISFQELLQVAFRGKFINTMDHPAIRRLRGEI